ncbi:hypothetical protein RND71_009044 [Anisodus tanguticus]|uniref:Uncharacterized protein n=1 Tax=Anisodus tanguticus TaxID=243964 RepID=A0AAE1VUQ5_9SOLA|nr:hypothetical protein RND71_009044 [Anisodus tanguticus]
MSIGIRERFIPPRRKGTAADCFGNSRRQLKFWSPWATKPVMKTTGEFGPTWAVDRQCSILSISPEIQISNLIPVSEAYLGRVVNALAKPIDGRGEISASEFRLIESAAPGIISRRSVYEPLQTGYKLLL